MAITYTLSTEALRTFRVAQFNAFVVPHKARTLPLRVWKPCCRRQLFVHSPLFHYDRISLLRIRLPELNFVGKKVPKICIFEFCGCLLSRRVQRRRRFVSKVEASQQNKCLFEFVQKRRVGITAKCGLKEKSQNRDWMTDSCHFYSNTVENDLSYN